MDVEFEAPEYQADGSLLPVRYRFQGSTEAGWMVLREGKPALELGPGYRLLRSERCGVCSTDLARRFLPFPLPQITGHEVVALDEHGKRYAVEINAPPIARGIETDCPFCRLMPNHCPDRLVLGIHDLPGGFGPYVLAPIHALHSIPDEIDDDAAVLIEPLAAALHGVATIGPQAGQSIAVLGPRKLGMLAVAALAGWRRQRNVDVCIVAMARRPDLLAIAREMGADEAIDTTSGAVPKVDVVIDCTGSPEGLEMAIEAARSEVHLKSTHGRPAAGLRHLTELVVDELSIARFDPERLPPALSGDRPLIGWLAGGQPPADLAARADVRFAYSAASVLDRLEDHPPPGSLPRVDAAVVKSVRGVELAIRPSENREVSVVRPRGAILLDKGSEEDYAASPLLRAVWERGLRLTSSRCGDFAAAIALLSADERLRAAAPRLITHRFPAAETAKAFEAAAGRASIKALVEHEVER
ncbi:MAG: alcohol dehydrogenase catalytic domain-containing protein [Bryobacterales bacterium]|nr:alcohol dehydrogenase catalytic domain-containing protein [Acidobacteriota bacterium]MCB9385936.1 alcohol dehydrogenase catalytic domain-containing protein [Bryobacterales bacterium]